MGQSQDDRSVVWTSIKITEVLCGPVSRWQECCVGQSQDYRSVV